MKDVKDLKISMGYVPSEDIEIEKQKLDRFLVHKDNIYDFHFSHYNMLKVPSGRLIPVKKESLLNFINLNQNEYGFKLTLLLNAKYDNLDEVLDMYRNIYYPLGVKSVCISDIELIRKFKENFDDVEIQGSCLSYRMIESELQEEREAGVVLHNPRMEIIRDTEQLKKNYLAGYRQKVLFSEGCLNYCPFEPLHRKSIENGSGQLNFDCQDLLMENPLYFLKASWITINRLRDISDYIDVIKISRTAGYHFNDFRSNETLENFLDIYENNYNYNILNFMRNSYSNYLKNLVKNIPSKLFDTEFFEKIEKCEIEDCKTCGKCEHILNVIYNKAKDEMLKTWEGEEKYARKLYSNSQNNE